MIKDHYGQPAAYIQQREGLFSRAECSSILQLRLDETQRRGRGRDLVVFADDAPAVWTDTLGLLRSRLAPLVTEYSKSFLDLLPRQHIDISHIGFLTDEHGSFTELHYDWELVLLKGRVLPKPFVVLIYLSEIEEGGDLLFPVQQTVVRPTLGKAAIFPCHFAFPHLSQPVLKGVKQVCRVTYRIHPDAYRVDELEI
jgi:hypothetical protein